MEPVDLLRFWKSQAIYWRYAVIADPARPLILRRALAKLSPSPYYPPHHAQRLILIAVPKVAGNSLIGALYGPDGAEILDRTAQHKPALVFKFADPARFAAYCKVAFVRNPWDRLVSAYAFMQSGGKHVVDNIWARRFIAPTPDFAAFVKALTTDYHFRAKVLHSPHFIPQSRFICDENGEVAVDFLGRYEALGEDFAALCRELNIEAELPKANVGDHEDYRRYYDDETRRIVGELYARDVEQFGYDFDG
jgi:hypothetical protein